MLKNIANLIIILSAFSVTYVLVANGVANGEVTLKSVIITLRTSTPYSIQSTCKPAGEYFAACYGYFGVNCNSKIIFGGGRGHRRVFHFESNSLKAS